MEPEGSLPHSQGPATCPYPEGDPLHTHTHTHTSHFLKILLILSFHLCLSLPSGIFPSGFPTKTLPTPLLSPLWATRPAQLILLDFISRKIFVGLYGSSSSSLCSFLSSPFLLSPLRHKYSSLHPILKQPQPTFLTSTCATKFTPIQSAGKIIFLYIIIFKTFDSKMEDRRFCTEWQQAFPDFV